MVSVFDLIYRENRWNGVESLSGPGSGDWATRPLVPVLLDLVDELHITSVLDMGCGDGYWMPDLPGYYGVDPSPTAVERARANHPDRAYGTTFPALTYDLVILRDVLQHLPLRTGAALVTKASRMGRWLLASTYVDTENVNIEAGDCFPANLTEWPYGLPQPQRLIFDGYHYHETDEIRDPSKHLGLWRVRT